MAKVAKGQAPKRPEPKKGSTYRAICHTTCFWLNTMWDTGDVYEGEIPPNKHFSKDGNPPNEDPEVRVAADDPRSTVEMVNTLRKEFGVELPEINEDTKEPYARKEIFELLRNRELARQGQGGIKAKK